LLKLISGYKSVLAEIRVAIEILLDDFANHKIATKLIQLQLRITRWLEKDEFELRILKSAGPRIVLFAADWCGYCRRFLEVIKEYQDGQLRTLRDPSDEVAIVNVDSGGGSLWEDFHIGLVPTLVVYLSNKEIFRRDGKPMIGLKRADLEDAIKTVTAKNA
jgi:thioredoxin-like negative regulator of GroEL